MAPMGVDPGIEAGFKAADQQSYLQQVLQNTRAEQQNAASLKAQQEQRVFDPSSVDDPAHGPEERAARRLDLGSMAHGAQPGPDGRPMLLYKDDKTRDQAIAFMNTQSGRRAAVEGDKAMAGSIRRNATSDMMGQDGKLDPQIERHLQTLEGNNAQDPNRELSRKAMTGMYEKTMPGEMDRNLITSKLRGNQTPYPSSGEGTGVNLDDPKVQEKLDQGWEPVMTTTKDAMGRETQKLVLNPPKPGATFGDTDALALLRKENPTLFPKGTNITNLNTDQRAALVQKKRDLQNSVKGENQHTVNITNQNDKLNAPATPKELATLWLPDHGDFATNIPGMHGKSAKELVDNYGAVDANTRGNVQKILENTQASSAALQHVDRIIQAWDQADKAGYIPHVGESQMANVVNAKIGSWKNAISQGAEPLLAALGSLTAGDLQILAGIAPPTGNRFGYSLMKYVNEKNPGAFSSMGHTYEGGRAALLEIRNLIEVKRQSQGIPILNRGLNASPTAAPPPPPNANPNTAGVSGAPSVADWLKGQQK